MFREDGTRRGIALPVGRTVIGRKEDCTIRIPLAEVSRHHAAVVVENASVSLRNLNASNGTFLNNRRIEEAEDLAAGDQITIGPVVFTVQIDGDPPEEEMIRVPTKISRPRGRGPASPAFGTSRHVVVSNDEIDPIAALEALASSTDQTAIHPELDDEEES